ncbi:autotransporter outer membrane beta-barrel domain-containing protein [Rodentibacter caecimuris]|uniref:autotransporter outer membrane beta-barrel domain-containing protein n=1 Tax=Rodentibacter caecimuris TaxID=1796644 RepID=UPI0013A08F59|nr:autotransporter outer membrane beta-barrel domain-containing protein [Rodentibacter heylii]QIA77290.1 autotransporter outer membrane beta-barrel domain-containing protein [Rodentibacter heylii]
MKNNKKNDRTFKLSLVAMALSMTNLAWAGEVACNNSRVEIIGQNGAMLNNCVIDQPAKYGKIHIENSPNTVVNNTQISVPNDIFSGIHIMNSNVELNNVTLSATLIEAKQISQVAVEAINSAVNINGGHYKTETTQETSEAFRLNNSTLNVKNATISLSGEAGSGLSLENNSIANLENVTITAINGADAVFYDADNNNTRSGINISNSTLKADEVLFGMVTSADQNTEGRFRVNINNSIFDAPRIIRAETDIVDGFSITENITFTASNSKLTGLMNVEDNKSKLDVTLTNSTWTIKPYFYEDEEEESELHSASVTNLALNNSVINLEQTDDFQTLTIKGNLTGSGIFNLNTNIAENKGDKIIIEGTAEGNHKLGVKDHGVAAANKKLTLVETNGGNAKFNLTTPNNRVDLGAYQYFLTKEGNNWVLANSQSVITPPTTPNVQPETPSTPTTPENPNIQPEIPSTPTASTNPNVQPETPGIPNPSVVLPVKPIQPSNPTLPSSPLLSNLANAQVSLRQAQLLLVESELSGIHQRLGDMKNGEKGNVWVRNVNSRKKLTALSTGDSQTSGFKQNVHSLQLGADVAVKDNFRLGGFIGRSQADVDFNGNYGDGKVRSNSVGLYATYLADNGIYMDNIVKYSRLKAQSDHTEKRHYNAYTVSSELGKQFKLSGDWIITPQAQLAWTHIQGKENEDSLSSIYSRVGLRVAKNFALANGWNLQPYAEINAITSRNNSSKVHYANAALNVEDSRGRFESILGVNAGITGHHIGLEISRADGKRYDKPYQIQAVYRYQW